MLETLVASGIEVIYSSYLVPADLQAPEIPPSADPLEAARMALDAHGLELRAIDARRYVVVRKEASAAPVKALPSPPPDAPLAEVSVYASRYAIEGRSNYEPMTLAGPDIRSIPGAHDDPMRALKSLPGLAGNLSARPYIRGSLSEDVLVRYDGVTLLDPYHLKNFQSLFSAIDPAAVDRIEVFSGGFPVQYGTRSGGVINVTAPSREEGFDNRIAISTTAASASTLGHADTLPLEWFGAIRRSTLDLLEPVENGLGNPEFADSLGRLRLQTENGAWSAGWLLLDDQLELGAPDDDEFANARYRDEYLWLTREHRFSDTVRTRLSAVLTTAERVRDGSVDNPGVAIGSVDESQEFDRFELTNEWTWDDRSDSHYAFGAEMSITHSDYAYARDVTFDPEIAAAFGRDAVESLHAKIKPRVVSYAVYAANRRQWSNFEAEVGVRIDAQDFSALGRRTQVSPRLNLRYDLNEQTRAYASVGRFTQAQHIEEWRIEEGQQRPDPAQDSIHSVLGLTYETTRGGRLSIEAYDKRWTRVSPYFDNTLDPMLLLPDLSPDRVRLAPKTSEASGLELNMRTPLFDNASAWGSMSWSRVTDEFETRDVLRSWDQSFAFNTGISWEGPRLGLSASAGWHRGWPRTPFDSAGADATDATLQLGPRNSQRWTNFYSLDLRATWTWRLARGDLASTLEVTNATNRANPCCSALEGSASGQFAGTETDHWLPQLANLGFTFRWHE